MTRDRQAKMHVLVVRISNKDGADILANTVTNFYEYKIGNIQLDKWSVKERLALACSVLRSGDQNWVSVSRAIKPYGEPDRPPEWFSQKNCALQYADLLEKVETPKRKGRERGEVETPSLQIVRKLTIERIEELKKTVLDQQQKYKKLKKEVEYIKSGQWDDRLQSIYQQMLNEKREAEEAARQAERQAIVEESSTEPIKSQEVKTDIVIKTEVIDDEERMERTEDTTGVRVKTEEKSPLKEPLTVQIEPVVTGGEEKPKPIPSPRLLTTLLSSKVSKVGDLTQLKEKTEQEHAKAEAAAAAACTASQVKTQTPEETTPKKLEPESSKTTDLEIPPAIKLTPKMAEQGKIDEEEAVKVVDDTASSCTTIPVEEEIVEIEEIVSEKAEEEVDEQEVQIENVVKEEVISIDQDESQESTETTGYIPLDDEISLKEKEEPMSPASSVSSKVSECDIINVGRRRNRARGSKGNRRRPKKMTKTLEDEKKDEISRLSDDDTTEEETVRESDDASVSNLMNTSSTTPFLESIPNSPLSHCDTEDEKAYKNWKKSIMLVWRSAANHKYANVFLHPVTNDIAPGYLGIVHRPMDLSVIKKNIEGGVIRTTSEFQRDIMLMFTNAIMYNNCNHNVHKMAVEMYNDVLQDIEQYVSTQIMVQTSDTKLLRGSRRMDTSDKEDETKRRRTSSEQHGEGGKSKKRKTRADDT